MTAPHQIVLDEAHNQTYVVEFASPGRLLRINLTTGAQTVLVSNLERVIGLLLTQDLQFAYVSEQAAGPGGGRVSRIQLSTGNRQVLVTGLTAPFFMTWTDPGESGILVSPTKRWAGIPGGMVPVSPWHATVPGDITSRRCAHTFYLGVWDRVINGWSYIHYSAYHKSITLMLP